MVFFCKVFTHTAQLSTIIVMISHDPMSASIWIWLMDYILEEVEGLCISRNGDVSTGRHGVEYQQQGRQTREHPVISTTITSQHRHQQK